MASIKNTPFIYIGGSSASLDAIKGTYGKSLISGKEGVTGIPLILDIENGVLTIYKAESNPFKNSEEWFKGEYLGKTSVISYFCYEEDKIIEGKQYALVKTFYTNKNAYSFVLA